MPTLQIRLDLSYRGHILRIAGKHPMAYRKTITGNGQSDHQLRGIVKSIFRLAPLHQGRIYFPSRLLTAEQPEAICAINFEMKGSHIVEHQIYIEIEQMSQTIRETLFERLSFFFQVIRRSIQTTQTNCKPPTSLMPGKLVAKPALPCLAPDLVIAMFV